MMIKRKESIKIIQTANDPKEKYIGEGKFSSSEHGKPSMARTNEDQELLDDMTSKIDDLQRNLHVIKDILKNAVRRDEKVIHMKTLVFNDIAAVKGESNIRDLKVTQINNTKSEALFTDFVRFSSVNFIRVH